MNSVIIKGRLTRDPDLRYTQAGNATCRFTVAVDRYSKNGEASADFISCTAFGKTGENIKQYMTKGSEILVRGSIKTGSYEKNGQKIYTTDVWVEGFEFCGSRNQQPSYGQPQQPYQAAPQQYQTQPQQSYTQAQPQQPSYQQQGMDDFVPVELGDDGDIPF